MGQEFFTEVTGPIPFGGLGSSDPLAFKVYQPDRLVLGKRMVDHLRPGVCFWHSFSWPGVDMFGTGTLDRPWLSGTGDPMAAARERLAVAFEFFTKLGIPYYCFHDRDVAPEGGSFAEFKANLDAIADDALGYQERTGVRLLWGTANLFTHPRFQGGAATNPDPEVFAYAAAQVKHMLEVTLRLGGENYVLWGGREGYDTLLNTDLKREGAQLARFLHLVVEHKHKIGFTGQLLIEPKPMEPTKHQYDYDSATVYGFLVRNGLEGEYAVNVEANHATLAGHSFHHEVAVRDRERVPRQHRRQPRRPAERLGHRPVPELGRGPDDADVRDPAGRRHRARRLQLRREAAPPEHRPHGPLPRPHRRARHARPGAPGRRRHDRGRAAGRACATSATPAGTATLGAAILGGSLGLADLEARVASGEIDPAPVSGAQERLENLVNQGIWRGRPGRASRSRSLPGQAGSGTLSTIGFTTRTRVSIVSSSYGAPSSTMNVWKPIRR